MTSPPAGLDAHEQPSEEMRAEWKHFARLDPSALEDDPRIDDPRRALLDVDADGDDGFRVAGRIPKGDVARAFAELEGERSGVAADAAPGEDVPVLEHRLLPGLLIIPNLVPPSIQKGLLSRMLHRDLSDSRHQTNLHLHYTLPYQEAAAAAAAAAASSSSPKTEAEAEAAPRNNNPPDSSRPSPTPSTSFFALSPSSPSPAFHPRDTTVHKPLTPRQVLTRRLHWLTLGGQYDWTNRLYPDQTPPPFPADLARLLSALFPETRPEAAIVNFYTPGDTMMMHRDVSEHTDRGLVSLSFGCDGLFMLAPNRPRPAEGDAGKGGGKGGTLAQRGYLLLRLRSGDAIYMTEDSRYAWHGVPRVMAGTCPDYLAKWPCDNGQYAEWEGWMSNKRINLNVRQINE